MADVAEGALKELLKRYERFMKEKLGCVNDGECDLPYVVRCGKHWCIAYHDGYYMGVIRPVAKATKNGVKWKLKAVYVGPIIRRMPDGRYMLYYGKDLAYIALSANEAVKRILSTIPPSDRIHIELPDGGKLAVTFPNRKLLSEIVKSAKWQYRKEIDWEKRRDYWESLRWDMAPLEAAKVLERRQGVLRRLRPNSSTAMQFEMLYIARTLANEVAPANPKALRQVVYLYGPTATGKSEFIIDVLNMFIPCIRSESIVSVVVAPLCDRFEEPLTDYHVYYHFDYLLSVPPNVLRKIFAYYLPQDEPPMVLDEVNLRTAVEAIKLATQGTVRLGSLAFELRRGLFLVSVVPYSKIQKHLHGDVAKRLVLPLQWTNYKMQEEAYRKFYDELRDHTPAVPPLIADLLQHAWDKLQGWTSLADLALRTVDVIEKLYGVNLSSYREALYELEQKA